VLFNFERIFAFLPLWYCCITLCRHVGAGGFLLRPAMRFICPGGPILLALILLSTTIVYCIGRAIAATEDRATRKTLLNSSPDRQPGTAVRYQVLQTFSTTNPARLLDGLGLGYAYAG
jgi:hypothetical protein